MIQDLGKTCTQLLVVDSKQMSLLEGGEQVIEGIPIYVGLKGVTKDKKEGDMKTPVGRFPLGTVFGDEKHRQYAIKMPYLLIEEGLLCVDDPKSCHYNQFVNQHTKERDWKSSENMKEIGYPYTLGIVIGYKGDGSCIFVHIGDGGTAGCVAMSEEDLIKVVTLLDFDKNPHIDIKQ